MIGVASVEASPALVILIRHAEKTEIKSDTHLSTRGRDRAKALVGFFTTNTIIASRTRSAQMGLCSTEANSSTRLPK